jgi:hypothetical protein
MSIKKTCTEGSVQLPSKTFIHLIVQKDCQNKAFSVHQQREQWTLTSVSRSVNFLSSSLFLWASPQALEFWDPPPLLEGDSEDRAGAERLLFVPVKQLKRTKWKGWPLILGVQNSVRSFSQPFHLYKSNSRNNIRNDIFFDLHRL